MRISIETLGTRGDVQPYVSLCLALGRLGHEVQLAGPAQFAALAKERGVRFAALPGEFLALLDTPEGKAAIANSRGFGAGLRLLKHVRPLIRRLLDEEWAAAADFEPDLIVYHPKCVAAPHIAERLAVPVLLASPLPGFTPTAAFPSPLLPFASLGPLNRASHLLAIHGAELLFRKLVQEWRASSLGLANRSRRRAPPATIYAYSRHVVPIPPDWGPEVLVSGYWFLDDERWQPPKELADFLSAGDKPVYVGFGSMPGIEPQALARNVIDGLTRSGKRGILATGGGALNATHVPRNVHVIHSAPHDRLFPFVSATLHHGGAGTTGASLRAGVPTIICPFFGDQPFWGRRVASLGVGPRPLDRSRLSPDVLAAAFKATDDPPMRQRAADLGSQIRAERGASTAANFIDRWSTQGATTSPATVTLSGPA